MTTLVLINSETEKNSLGEDLISGYVFDDSIQQIDFVKEAYVNGELTMEAQLHFHNLLQNPIISTDLEIATDLLKEEALYAAEEYQNSIMNFYGEDYSLNAFSQSMELFMNQ